MIIYDAITMTNPMIAFIIPDFALPCKLSLPEIPARINNRPATTIASVITVPIKNVADSTISCTNSIGEVLLADLLMPRVS